MRVSSFKLISGVALAGLFVGTLPFLSMPLDQETANAAARMTARWSFCWFILAWSASSLATLWPGGWRETFLRHRRAVGLSFAGAHFVHAGFFLIAIFGFGVERPLATYLGGGFVYLLIAAMAATSNDASVRWLGWKRWKLLHAIGGWAALAVFSSSYAGRIPDMPVLGVTSVGIILTAVLLRGLAWRKRRLSARAH
ncbi:hypothetical protein ACFSM5_09165 [Lacibacterium aquatile]|uniref:Ferric oxidoreductase domain-containing protein n=1 Tax=Lacibacterium aquatile TaxID=1168082 RepID=A0ABW5DRC1_9PROT